MTARQTRLKTARPVRGAGRNVSGVPVQAGDAGVPLGPKPDPLAARAAPAVTAERGRLPPDACVHGLIGEGVARGPAPRWKGPGRQRPVKASDPEKGA